MAGLPNSSNALQQWHHLFEADGAKRSPQAHGRNQKPGQRLRGNIPAAFCAAITPLVSFTQWR